MTIQITDTGAPAKYRIEVDRPNGKVLVTEGVADSLTYETSDDWYSPKASLTLESVTMEQREEEGPQVEEATEPVPQLKTVKGSVGASGNPYLDSSAVYLGQAFGVSRGGSYLIENFTGSGNVRLQVGKNGAASSAYLDDRERIELAARLLSVAPHSVREFNGVSQFIAPECDYLDHHERAIGSVIYTLHSVLVSMENEGIAAEITEIEQEKAEREKEEDDRKEAEVREARALHALAVFTYMDYFGRTPSEAERVQEDHPSAIRGVASRLAERLRQRGVSAVEEAEERGIAF